MRTWIIGNRFVVMLGLALLFSVAGTGQADAKAVQLNIQAQQLTDSLTTVAEVFALQIAFFPEDVQDIEAPALSGMYTADQAFARLLEDTPLEHRFLDEDSVAIGQKKAADQAEPPSAAGNPQDSNADEPQNQTDQAAGDEGTEDQGEGAAPVQTFAGEVTVTAQKREQELKDVPVAVQAFEGSALQESNIRDLSELVTFVPGASESISYGAGQRTYQIRGISNSRAGDPTTGYYLDDTAFLGVGLALAPIGRTFDVERVEVLRGPQGTLWGNGSMGGTVRYITNMPSLTTFEGSLGTAYSTTAGGDPGYYVDAAVSVPIVENKLALRLVGTYDDIGGYADMPSLGLENTNPATMEHMRANLLWAPTDRLIFRFQYATSQSDQDGSLYVSTLDPPISAQAPGDYLNFGYDLISGTIEYNFDFATLTSATGYVDAKWDLLYNIAFPWAPDGVLKFGYSTAPEFFNNETRLVSTTSGPAQWVAGVFYTDSDAIITLDTNLEAIFPDSVQKTSSKAMSIFGEFSWEFMDGKLVPLVGLRYFEDDRSASASTMEEVLGPYTFDDLAPRLSLSYKPSDDSNYYFNISKGFRSGSFNTPGVCDILHRQVGGLPCEMEVPSDELWSYEVGSKLNFAGRQVFLDTSIYYEDWLDNRQAVGYGGATQTYQIGDIAVPGIDIGLNYTPTSISGLSLELTANWNDAHFSTIDPAIAEFIPLQVGDRPPYVPEWTASAAANYVRPVTTTWVGMASLGFSHIEPQWGLFTDTIVLGDSRNLLRARIGATNGSWGIYLFGKNLLNENGAVFVEPPSEGGRSIQDYPREVGLELTFDF